MIKSFTVKNYKALRDVTVELTPVHVLIGPNDAGKTSFLEAVAALSSSVDRDVVHGFPGRWKGTDLLWARDVNNRVVFQVTIEDGHGTISYQLGLAFWPSDGKRVETLPVGDDYSERIILNGDVVQANRAGQRSWICSLHAAPSDEQTPRSNRVFQALSGHQLYRWVPKHLAMPVAPANQPPFQLWPSGFGLVHCLDDILDDDRDRFVQLEKEFVEYFPEMKKIILRREPALAGRHDPFDELTLSEAPGKGLYFELKGGGLIPASQVSDGVLIILAYLSILHIPQPPRILMIEEPENGIHPKRLKEVVKILKGLVKTHQHTQVILTTHSPYLLDHFAPAEVTVFKKEADGSVSTHKLSNSKAVKEQRKLFTLGEIWSGEGEERLARNVAQSGAKRR